MKGWAERGGQREFWVDLDGVDDLQKEEFVCFRLGRAEQ